MRIPVACLRQGAPQTPHRLQDGEHAARTQHAVGLGEENAAFPDVVDELLADDPVE
jgi:hypothetical protein